MGSPKRGMVEIYRLSNGYMLWSSDHWNICTFVRKLQGLVEGLIGVFMSLMRLSSRLGLCTVANGFNICLPLNLGSVCIPIFTMALAGLYWLCCLVVLLITLYHCLANRKRYHIRQYNKWCKSRQLSQLDWFKPSRFVWHFQVFVFSY